MSLCRMTCPNAAQAVALGKFHLYDQVGPDPPADPDTDSLVCASMTCHVAHSSHQTLKDAGFKHAMELFVWDGATVSGRSVPVGIGCEPIVVGVATSERDAGDEDSHGINQLIVPKNMTLRHLKDTIIEACFANELDDVALFRLDKSTKTKKGSIQPHCYATTDDDKTLAELGIMTHTRLMAERPGQGSDAAQRANVEMLRLQRTVDLRVVNRCGDDSDGPIELAVERTLTVAQLKATIKERLVLGAVDGGGRLRLKDKSGDTADRLLSEAQTLKDAGISTDAVVIIEPGAPPDASKDIVVRFALCQKALVVLNITMTLAATGRTLSDLDINIGDTEPALKIRESSGAGDAVLVPAHIPPVEQFTKESRWELVLPRAVWLHTAAIHLTLQQTTAAQCLRGILAKAGLSGDEWHLTKTNWLAVDTSLTCAHVPPGTAIPHSH